MQDDGYKKQALHNRACFLDLVSFVMHSVFDDFQHFVGRDVVFTHVVEKFLVVGLSLLCLDLLELSFELFDLVFFFWIFASMVSIFAS